MPSRTCSGEEARRGLHDYRQNHAALAPLMRLRISRPSMPGIMRSSSTRSKVSPARLVRSTPRRRPRRH